MAILIQPEAPPLREDASGALRVGSSRVLVELVVRAFQDGTAPEAIAQRYPSATLADIYAVIAYYLRHRQEVEAYLAARSNGRRKCANALSATKGTSPTSAVVFLPASTVAEVAACCVW
jgi:uncharacterized protein (DUF433 family)